MQFRIPFTLSNLEKLKIRSRPFRFLIRNREKLKNSKIQKNLENSNIKITAEDYLPICYRGFTFAFFVSYLISGITLFLLGVNKALLLALGISLLFGTFVFLRQRAYPKIFDSRRVRRIEKNLIAALQDMLVQLNSGIPLYNILANIASSKYGELSLEFKKAVKKISAGFPQIEVLEELGEKNSSKFLKRALWQISNGMRAGSDISIVIEESIKTLSKEQLLQIQTYGSKLNPLIMFYMLISVIMPALSITFLTIISSMVNLPKTTTTLLFVGLLVFVILLQVMFLGMIRSIRPTLL